MVTMNDINAFIQRHHLENSILCFHSSLKSFGEVENGAKTIIDGFLRNGMTLVCPAFFYESETYPPSQNYEQNGIDYQAVHSFAEKSFNDEPQQIESSMGIIPKTLLTYPEAVRTKHPLNSFVVIGKYAAELTSAQSLLNVYAIYKQIYAHKIPAYILLAGVDFTSCTPIHFAEERAGKNLFRRWAIYHHAVTEVEVGSCSEGFERLAEYTKDIEKTDVIGKSKIRLYGFKEFIDVVSKTIQQHRMTIYENQACLRCHDMRLGGRKIAY